MPGLITHYVFGREAIKTLPKDSFKEIIRTERRAFYLGTQGPDLFSYRFYRLRHKNHKNIGSYLHHHRTKRFFEEGLKVWNSIKEKQSQECFLAYLTGFLCHYVSDSICHPFVYARTEFDPKHPTSEYYGRHLALENRIDSYYAEHYLNQDYVSFRQDRIFDLAPTELAIIAEGLSKTLQNTLEDLEGANENTPEFIRRTIQMARLESKLLSDPSSKKKTVIEAVERAALGYHLLSDKLVVPQPQTTIEDLNLNRESWKNPWKPEEYSFDSFPELFKRAVKHASGLLFVLSEQPLKLPEFLDDTPYHSGTV